MKTLGGEKETMAHAMAFHPLRLQQKKAIKWPDGSPIAFAWVKSISEGSIFNQGHAGGVKMMQR